MAQHNNMFNVLKPTIMKKLNSHQYSVLRGNTPFTTMWLRMFFLCIVAVMSSALVQAQTKYYNIEVAGVAVSSDNCADLSVIPGVEGKINFNPETNTLYMKNVTINSEKDGIVVLNQTKIFIKIVGENSITSSRTPILLKKSKTIINGYGEIRLNTSEYSALKMSNSSLTLENLYLYAEGKCGIAGENNDNDVLTIRRSYIEATGSEGSVCGISGLTLEECFIKQPENAEYNKQRKSVTLNGETVTDKVVVEPTIMYYGLMICGASVSTRNYNDLSVIDGVKGKLSYNLDTKILTMEDCTINSVFSGIIITGEDITVEVLGNNSITTEGVGILVDQPYCTISGSGTLSVNSPEEGIMIEEQPLTIENVKLFFKGDTGIYGYKNGSDLTLKNVYAELDARLAMRSINNLTLDGCYITQPQGAAFNAEFRSVMLDGKYVGNLVIAPPVDYGFSVAGEDVTSLNCADLSFIPGVEGKMSYSPKTNTLTMQDVTIDNVDNGIFINSSSEGLNIEVLGDNSITTENVCITGWNKPCNISGSGTLRLKSAESAGIYAFCSQTVIEGVKLYTEGLYGIGGYDGESGEELIVRNAYVEATGSNGSICDFQNVVLDGCSITQPAGAAFDANVHAVALNGVKVTDKVVIKPDNYGILIAGKDVTTQNCADLSIIEGVSGNVSFDPDTKTLTLANATIEVDGSNAIYNNTYKDLVIELIGTNTINVTNSAGIYLCESTAIKGNSGSKLSITNDRCAVLFESSPLEIVNCWLEVEGDWGISANDNVAEEVLTIRNSHVEATGPTGSICDIANLVLDGCSIKQPEGAVYDAGKKAVALNGKVVTDKVVIEPSASGINDITADVPARKKGIFTVQGVKQTQSWNELPAGIYIVDGVKRVKK